LVLQPGHAACRAKSLVADHENRIAGVDVVEQVGEVCDEQRQAECLA
jgi:hypothetical protein